MIRVTIDIVPRGDETRVRRVGVVEIANVSEGVPHVADYAVTLDGAPAFRVESHLRAFGLWLLLSRVFAKAVQAEWQ